MKASTPRRRAGQASLATPKVRRAFPTREDATAGCLSAECVGIFPAMRGLRFNKIESDKMDALRYVAGTKPPKVVYLSQLDVSDSWSSLYDGVEQLDLPEYLYKELIAKPVVQKVEEGLLELTTKGHKMRLPHPPKPFFNTEALKAIAEQRMELALRKNHDYSGTMDAIAIAGVEGIGTRLLDKAARLHSLVQPGMEAKVTDESIRDTLMDMANYAEYGVSLMDGTWGKMPPPRPVVAYVPEPPTIEKQFANGLCGRHFLSKNKKSYWAVDQQANVRQFCIGDTVPFGLYLPRNHTRIIKSMRTAEKAAIMWAKHG